MVETLDSTIQFWHWLVLGIFLAALEMFLPSFFMLWLGVSAALVGILLAFIPMPFFVQLILWASLSLICLLGWFRYVAPKMGGNKTTSGMAKEALQGQVGTVLEYQADLARGKLRFPAPLLGEDEWSFICEAQLNPGDRVSVRDISGNTLIVDPKV